MAVTRPIKYAKHKSNNRVALTIGIVWIISVGIGSPIVLGLNTSPERIPELCIFYNSDFIIYSSLGSFYIPCVLMVFLYYRIFKAIRDRAKKHLGSASTHHKTPTPTQQQQQQQPLPQTTSASGTTGAAIVTIPPDVPAKSSTTSQQNKAQAMSSSVAVATRTNDALVIENISLRLKGEEALLSSDGTGGTSSSFSSSASTTANNRLRSKMKNQLSLITEAEGITCAAGSSQGDEEDDDDDDDDGEDDDEDDDSDDSDEADHPDAVECKVIKNKQTSECVVNVIRIESNNRDAQRFTLDDSTPSSFQTSQRVLSSGETKTNKQQKIMSEEKKMMSSSSRGETGIIISNKGREEDPEHGIELYRDSQLEGIKSCSMTTTTTTVISSKSHPGPGGAGESTTSTSGSGGIVMCNNGNPDSGYAPSNVGEVEFLGCSSQQSSTGGFYYLRNMDSPASPAPVDHEEEISSVRHMIMTSVTSDPLTEIRQQKETKSASQRVKSESPDGDTSDGRRSSKHQDQRSRSEQQMMTSDKAVTPESGLAISTSPIPAAGGAPSSGAPSVGTTDHPSSTAPGTTATNLPNDHRHHHHHPNGSHTPDDPNGSSKKKRSRFNLGRKHKSSRKKREKASAKRERKATKTLAIVLGKYIDDVS